MDRETCLSLFPFTNFNAGLQTQSSVKPEYKGPFDAIKKIYSAHGIPGVFKGQGVTLVREAAGYGVYFLAYEKLVQREMVQKGIRRDQLNPVNAVLYGAAAGYAVSPFRLGVPSSRSNPRHAQLWAIIYPIDMIKSRMQTDGFSAATGQKYKSAIDCVRTVWRTEGIAAFTRGLTPTLIRSVSSRRLRFVSLISRRSPFANGATFLGFEMASRVLNS